MNDSTTSKRQLPLDEPSDDQSLKMQRTNEALPDTEHVDPARDKVSDTQRIQNQTEIGDDWIVGDLVIVEFNQVFESTDEDIKFSHTKVILQRNGSSYFAKIKSRIKSKEEIDTAMLEVSPIPQQHVYPILPTQAPSSISVETFIKQPSMISYADAKSLTEISSLFMHEAQMCERLKRSPHPNVARYFGCHLDEHGLIRGLCFKKYSKTLHQMVRAGDAFDRPECLENIKAGIKHLHSLGIIHCDINPHNIFADRSTFVIADFDSCTFEGDELGMKGGTDGWTNDEFEFAKPENDWFGFAKIKEYLVSATSGKRE